jgi:hypothetical protein
VAGTKEPLDVQWAERSRDVGRIPKSFFRLTGPATERFPEMMPIRAWIRDGRSDRSVAATSDSFYDPHLTPESIAENFANVQAIEGFFEPGPFEPGT